MGKHLLDETAEFTLPQRGRHADPETGELDATQRMDTGSTRPGHRPRPVLDGRSGTGGATRA